MKPWGKLIKYTVIANAKKGDGQKLRKAKIIAYIYRVLGYS